MQGGLQQPPLFLIAAIGCFSGGPAGVYMCREANQTRVQPSLMLALQRTPITATSKGAALCVVGKSMAAEDMLVLRRW